MHLKNTIIKETSSKEIERIFNLQRANQFVVARTSYKERREILKRLHDCIISNRKGIQEAIFNDFRKPSYDTDMTEIFPVTGLIKHTRRNIKKWMRKKKVPTPIALLGSKSYIHYEPKGMALIISPWNFPINTIFRPMVAAIAAGNVVILKPSEIAPHSAKIVEKIVKEVFNENEVAVIQGGIPTTTALLSLPFNHVFFTGSSAVGKIVMKAASKHLTSVTLELGGKSPTIIDETADLEMTARRIALGKWINNGQICIAPDFIFIHRSVAAEFIKKLKKHLVSYYGEDASKSKDYSRIINAKHYRRVIGYMDGAIKRGAKVVFGGVKKEDEQFLSPTLMTEVPLDCDLMTEEIFGPIMPILLYDDLQEVLSEIQSREKPLALYIYSQKKKNIEYILNNTRAGGTCINQSGIHFFNYNLPFGGSNNSGIGKGGGFFGFEEFSNPRGVLDQKMENALDKLSPPYTNAKQKFVDFTLKWL